MNYDNDLKKLFTLFMNDIQKDREFNLMCSEFPLGEDGIAIQQYLRGDFKGHIKALEYKIKDLLHCVYQKHNTESELYKPLKNYFDNAGNDFEKQCECDNK